MSEKIKPGMVWLEGKGMFRPFLQFREIRKGRNTGKIEITLPAQPARKVLVDPSSIRRYPVVEGMVQEKLPLSEGSEAVYE